MTKWGVRDDNKKGLGRTIKRGSGEQKRRLGVTEKRGSWDQRVGSGRQKEASKYIIELFGLRKQKDTK